MPETAGKERMVNILYLCADRGIPVRGDKGAAVHVRSLIAAWARAGHTVTLLTANGGPAGGAALAGRVIEVKGEDSAESPAAYVDHFLAAARQQAARRAYDFIYERYSLWSDAGARLSQATGLPLALEVNAPLAQEAARYRALTDIAGAEAVARRQFAAARLIAVVSEELREYVIGRGGSAENTLLLPNAVDPQLFHPGVDSRAVRRRYQLDDRLVVGFVGRPRPWHDLDTLLRAVSQLRAADPRFHLLLVGQMPPELPARLAELGLSDAATLTGPVPHAAVPAHIAAMQVAVSPHAPLDDFYFSPLKLYEYLACAAPVVAAGIGQPARLIEPGVNGYLYSPGDAAALAACIARLADDPRHARDVAWRGAALALHGHTWDDNARAVVDGLRGAPRTTPTSGAVARPLSGARAEALPLPLIDHRLRHRLYRATRPDLAAPWLARCLGARRVTVETITPLKYKPGRRAVLRYTLTVAGKNGDSAESRQVIGKLFRDERGQRLHALQDALWRTAFHDDAPDQICVARSLGYVAKARMQVQALAQGVTLNELAAQQDVTPLIPRAAQALAKLHNWTPPPDCPPLTHYGLEEELANWERFVAEMAEIRPKSMPAILPLYHALLAWAARLAPPPALVPAHRDFYYSQLLFDGPRVTLIDFDLFAWADPALDVANFAAHQEFLGLDLFDDRQALAAQGRQFLAAYGEWRPPDAAFGERFAFYRAATFFRLLSVVAPRPGLVRCFEPLLAHTADLLGLAPAVER